jgi:hypothetical protein
MAPKGALAPSVVGAFSRGRVTMACGGGVRGIRFGPL